MTSDNTGYYQGTTTVPNGWSAQPYNAPHICPGCGRCKDCGRPYETQPYNPWPGYPNPYIGDPLPNPWGGTYWGPNTIGGISGTDNIGGLTSSAGPHNHQVWM